MMRLMSTVSIVLLGALLASCGGGTESIAPPAPEYYTATGDFWNFVVLDGSLDTRLTVVQSDVFTPVDQLLPGGGATARNLTLTAENQSVPIGFFLSYTDSSIMNAGQTFPVREGQHRIYVAMGRPWTTNDTVAPRILQMPPAETPGPGQVAVRFVHVNGEVIEGLAFGEGSATTMFTARGADQDSLYVMPAGQAPDPDAALLKNLGGSLFANGARYECFLGHQPQEALNGDVNGAIRLYQFNY
jgi:hypothetical protein